MKNLIIASTSTLHNGSYLDYLLPTLKEHFKNVKTLLFVPYARPSGISHDEYRAKEESVVEKIGIDVKRLHQFENPKEANEHAQGIFTGAGNTFLLVYHLYKNDVMNTLQQALIKG